MRGESSQGKKVEKQRAKKGRRVLPPLLPMPPPCRPPRFKLIRDLCLCSSVSSPSEAGSRRSNNVAAAAVTNRGQPVSRSCRRVRRKDLKSREEPEINKKGSLRSASKSFDDLAVSSESFAEHV